VGGGVIRLQQEPLHVSVGHSPKMKKNDRVGRRRLKKKKEGAVSFSLSAFVLMIIRPTPLIAREP